MKLVKANDGRHKFIAIFENGKKTKFGAVGFDDYTLHHDKKRRQLYRIRHNRDLRTNDPTRAGFLSYYLLWNKETLEASLRDYKKRFGNL